MSTAAPAFENLPGISPGVYGRADFDAVRRIVHAEAGIVMPEGKAMLVYSRLAPRVRTTGAGTFSSYVELIGRDAQERRRAICALTTNHTFFFREMHHFDHFRDRVRPELVRALGDGKPVRLWSAGCSSGEELWSLVMTMLGDDAQEAGRLLSADLRFLATDIALHALRTALAATYPAKATEAVPAALLKRWMKADGEDHVVAEAAQAIARIRELNLLGDWPMRNAFDVIFCRNVMIYFDLPTKETLVARFARQLRVGGHLFIGHSERVTGAATELLEQVGPTIYRRTGR